MNGISKILNRTASSQTLLNLFKKIGLRIRYYYYNNRLFVKYCYNNRLFVKYCKIQQRALLKKTKRDHLVHTTCFCRSPFQLEALCGPVMEHLADKKKSELKIKMFGCSQGSEPYTVASTLINKKPELNFSILASDINQKIINIASKGRYSRNEVYSDKRISDSFIKQTFDEIKGDFRVKKAIRSHISFIDTNLLDSSLESNIGKADIVFAQNILIHFPTEEAKQALKNIIRIMNPHSVLFIDGMLLDLRQELTKKENLIPLDFKVKEIHEYARTHIPHAWWKFPWGLEPFSDSDTDYLHRYSTIFLKNKTIKAI